MQHVLHEMLLRRLLLRRQSRSLFIVLLSRKRKVSLGRTSSRNTEPYAIRSNPHCSPMLMRIQGEVDVSKPIERPYDMPEDETFLRAGLGEDEKERQLAM